MRGYCLSSFAVLAISALHAPPAAAASASCNTVGNYTYCSDGAGARRIGNTTYDNKGNSWNRVGNYTYGSDGSSCSSIGDYVQCRSAPGNDSGDPAGLVKPGLIEAE